MNIMLEINHGITSEKVDLLNRDSALAGSSHHFMESFRIINNTSVTDSNFLNIFSSRFDLDNYRLFYNSNLYSKYGLDGYCLGIE